MVVMMASSSVSGILSSQKACHDPSASLSPTTMLRPLAHGTKPATHPTFWPTCHVCPLGSYGVLDSDVQLHPLFGLAAVFRQAIPVCLKPELPLSWCLRPQFSWERKAAWTRCPKFIPLFLQWHCRHRKISRSAS